MAFGGVCVIAMLVDLYRHYSAWREQFILTEDGLVISGIWHRSRSIPWREARLFALDGRMVRGRNSFILLFELSSANEVICWEWVVHINADMVPQADLPFFSQGYDLQLEATLTNCRAYRIAII